MTEGVARLRGCAVAWLRGCAVARLRGCAVLRENILCYSDLFVNVKYVLLVSMPHLRGYSPNVVAAWCAI